jgi:hypothetical protein
MPCRSAGSPPHFDVVENGVTYPIQRGRNNCFDAIVVRPEAFGLFLLSS